MHSNLKFQADLVLTNSVAAGAELAIKEGAGFKVASKQVLSVRQEEGVDVEEALLLLATLRLST